MSVRIDAKGKYYTDVVRKEEVPVLIQTVVNTIHGNIFLRPEQRIKDELNDSPDTFIAVSKAQVYNHAGQMLYQSDFLTVNKHHVVWIRPDPDEPNQAAAPGPAAE